MVGECSPGPQGLAAPDQHAAAVVLPAVAPHTVDTPASLLAADGVLLAAAATAAAGSRLLQNSRVSVGSSSGPGQIQEFGPAG